jgi:hypothetical protein
VKKLLLSVDWIMLGIRSQTPSRSLSAAQQQSKRGFDKLNHQ